MSVHEFYYTMTYLWDQLALIESNGLKECGACIAQREEQRLMQFLMALHSDFERLRGSILHRSPLSFVDSIISELLTEERRLKSHSEMGILSAPSPSILAFLLSHHLIIRTRLTQGLPLMSANQSQQQSQA